jgi:methylase of polypeptide subunit release factors
LEATPKYRVIGTDLSKSAVATAQQHAHQRFQHIPNINDRVTFADADFTRLTSVPAIS